MSASTNRCGVCGRGPCCRVVDVRDRLLRVCAACAAVFRTEPEALLEAVRRAYADEDALPPANGPGPGLDTGVSPDEDSP